MGEAHDTLHFLVAGRVVLEKADLERQEVAQRPLDFWSCLTQSRHRYSAVCVEECTLLAAPTAAILDLVDEQPEFGVALLKQLAAQVVQEVPYL
jgi:CRP-like cAMP-binding protein